VGQFQAQNATKMGRVRPRVMDEHAFHPQGNVAAVPHIGLFGQRVILAPDRPWNMASYVSSYGQGPRFSR